MTALSPDAARAVLRWHADMGVDEAVGAAPFDWYAPSEPAPAASHSKRVQTAPAEAPRIALVAPAASADEAARAAALAAAAAMTFDALEAAVRAFDGCSLKPGARNTVFADGVPGAELLVIGEAPGREEDATGKPFVGRAGQLLDRMLAAIGRSRASNTLISNVVYWRPPGNRAPTQIELAVCRPFVESLIELTAPKVVLIAGGVSLQALLGLPSIMRARGVFRTIETKSGFRVDALPVFHPAFLLRSPAQKRLAWADLVALERRLTGR